MNKAKPIVSAWVLACLLVIACANFGSKHCFAANTKTDSETVVRMGSFSKAIDYAPYLVARHKHLFEEALKSVNCRLTYEVFHSLPAINEAIASKKLDVVFESEVPAVVGKAAGVGLKIVAVSSVIKVQILVRKNSGISKVKDLRGKKIAVLAGTAAHYGVLKNLERVGLTKNDVSIVDMNPPDARSAFDSKKVDAWAVWPPFEQQEEIAGTGLPLRDYSGQTVLVMVAREGFAAEHRPILKTLVSVLEKTKQWISTHPTESEEIVAGELNIPLAVVKLAWPCNDWQAQLTDSVRKDIQDKADFLESVGFVRKRVEVGKGFIDTSFKTAANE